VVKVMQVSVGEGVRSCFNLHLLCIGSLR